MFKRIQYISINSNEFTDLKYKRVTFAKCYLISIPVPAGVALRGGRGGRRAPLLLRGGELPGRAGEGNQGTLRPPHQDEEGRRRRWAPHH